VDHGPSAVDGLLAKLRNIVLVGEVLEEHDAVSLAEDIVECFLVLVRKRLPAHLFLRGLVERVLTLFSTVKTQRIGEGVEIGSTMKYSHSMNAVKTLAVAAGRGITPS
jgi:hypothetical protein